VLTRQEGDARIFSAMESFENKFWRRFNHPQTKGDLAARDVMDKVGRRFRVRSSTF
jgi:hypothetical protein